MGPVVVLVNRREICIQPAAYRDFSQNAQNGQKVPQNGVPPKNTIFNLCQGYTHVSVESRKTVQHPPPRRSGVGKSGALASVRNFFRGCPAHVKLVFSGDTPTLGHVLAILGILAEITVRCWLNTNFACGPYGVASEVI